MYSSMRRSPPSPTRRGGRSSPASLEGEASVTELAEPFAMTQPAISKHLKVLERAGLVSRRRDAQRRPCRLEADALRARPRSGSTSTGASGPSATSASTTSSGSRSDTQEGPRPMTPPSARPRPSSRSATGRSASCGRSGPRASSCSTPTPSPSSCAAGWARPSGRWPSADRPAPRRQLPLRDARPGRRAMVISGELRRGRPAVTARVDRVLRRRLERRRDLNTTTFDEVGGVTTVTADRRVRLGGESRERGAGHPMAGGMEAGYRGLDRLGPAARRRRPTRYHAAPTASTQLVAAVDRRRLGRPVAVRRVAHPRRRRPHRRHARRDAAPGRARVPSDRPVDRGRSASPPTSPPAPTSRRCLADAGRRRSPTCETPMGRMSVAEHIDGVVSTDLVLHGWDLARAAGLDDTIDPAEVERMWPTIQPIPDEMRIPEHFGPGVVVFGPEVPVPTTRRSRTGSSACSGATRLGGDRLTAGTYGCGRGNVTHRAQGVTMPFEYPVISADSHITEPPDCYTAHIDPAFRDQAPHMVTDAEARRPVRRAGHEEPDRHRPRRRRRQGRRGAHREPASLFADLHRSGWDPTARVADQDRDGVSAEIIYPIDRDDDLQPPRHRLQAGLLPGLQPLDHRVLLGGPEPAARHRADRAAQRRRGHRRSRGDRRRRPARRDDARHPRHRGGLRRPDLGAVLGGRRRPRPAAQLPHPHARAARAGAGPG